MANSPILPPPRARRSFTLGDLFVGILMLATVLGGFRGIFAQEDVPKAIRVFAALAIGVGLGGLYGLFFRRNAWKMALLGVGFWLIALCFVMLLAAAQQ